MFKKFTIAYDHRVGENYISRIKDTLKNNAIEYVVVEDNGESNDYPLLAEKCYQIFLDEKADGMILLCGTGIGMNVVANKFSGIRSVLASYEAQAYFSRRHENANCLVFGAGYSDEKFAVTLDENDMSKMINTFVNTDFEGDRHIRRLNEITDIENKK